MTMRERIANGKLFTDYCEGLPEDRLQAKLRMLEFNSTRADELEKRFKLQSEIFGKRAKAWIEPPIYFCYGTNIEIGDGCYINVNCNFVDDGKVIIGDKVMFGPNVTVATVGHPIHPNYREYMYALPVEIKANCWIGASVTICPGVTIGENTVIGAGSVVTKDIPANCIAVGNPCKVLRYIDENDEKYYYKECRIDKKDLEEEANLR